MENGFGNGKFVHKIFAYEEIVMVSRVWKRYLWHGGSFDVTGKINFFSFIFQKKRIKGKSYQLSNN